MDRSVCGLLGTEPHTRRWAMGQEANLHLYLQLLPVHVTTWVPFSVTWAAALDSHRSVRSDQISCSVMSDTLWHHELQHTRPPCPSPSPGVHSDSHPSSRWCHPAISSSVFQFSSCSQSLPASESFPMSQLFAWGGQSTGVSALASILPKNTNPTINCIHEGSRLHTPHENVMHDHLILHDGELYNYFIIYHTVLIIGIKLKRESVSCSVMSDSLWPHGL